MSSSNPSMINSWYVEELGDSHASNVFINRIVEMRKEAAKERLKEVAICLSHVDKQNLWLLLDRFESAATGRANTNGIESVIREIMGLPVRYGETTHILTEERS